MIPWSSNPQQYSALVVDENQHFAQITKKFLVQAGIRSVVHTTSPEEALGYLTHMTVSVVFVDLHVTPGGGIELLKKLRDPNFSPYPTIPVIMMANGATMQDVCAARDAGSTEFLAKPVSLKGMERVLKSALERERDFVVVANYRGPDRRRRKVDDVARDRRRPRLVETESSAGSSDPAPESPAVSPVAPEPVARKQDA